MANSNPLPKPFRYLCMPHPVLAEGALRIEAIQPEHIERIRQWRNEQMDVLRQTTLISPEQQQEYFERQIWSEADSLRPTNVLVAYIESGQLIGYGGLVHIAWEHRRAEVSFLLNTSLARSEETSSCYFRAYLRLIKRLAFCDLGLHRLSTETYAIRAHYLVTLEMEGFRREGVLSANVWIAGQPVDSVLHGCLDTYEDDLSRESPAFNRGYLAPGHVLVTSASSRKAPLVRSVMVAARKLHPDNLVFAGDCDKNSLSRYVADDFWQTPQTSASEIDKLIDGCKERGICTIIPTRDGELDFWALHQASFLKEGIAVVVPPVSAVATCLDKLAFSRFGASKKLPIIPTGLSPEEIGPGPYVVKERYGAGSRQIGLNLDHEAVLIHAQSMQEPVFQPFIAGREISIDAWVDKKHHVKGVVLRNRDQVVDGESQVTTTFRDHDIEAVAREILEALQLRGPVVLQALVDSNQRLHVIECNSRFGGASTASIAAGLDLFYWSLLEATGVDTSIIAFRRNPKEVRQVRLMADIIVHDPDI